MNVTKNVKQRVLALLTGALFAATLVLPGFTSLKVNAQEYDYTVSLVPGTFEVEIPSDQDSISLSQEDMRGMVKTGSLYIEDGAPLSVPGSIVGMDQLFIVPTKSWNEYVNGSDTITQDHLATMNVTAQKSNFTNPVLGESSTMLVPLTAVVFNKSGNVMGLGHANVLIRQEAQTETVINGDDYKTIITKINALASKLDAVGTVDGYTALADEVNTAIESMDAGNLADAITSVENEISALEASIDPTSETYDSTLNADEVNAKKADLENTLVSLSELKAEYEKVNESQNLLREKLNALKEEYNSVQAELENLHQVAGSENTGYAGMYNGEPCVYINGEAFPYELPGEDYVYTDEIGDHDVVLYHAKAGFDFFITINGVNVVNSDGSIVLYEDTLFETLVKADAMIDEIGKELVDLQTSLSGFYNNMGKLIGSENVKGKTNDEVLDNIQNAVKGIVVDYNRVKKNYVDAIQTLNSDLTEEEILKLSNNGVRNLIRELKESALDVQDTIQRSLTGENVNDANRLTLQELSKQIGDIVNQLATYEAELDALHAALGEEDPAAAIAKTKDLVNQINALTAENNALEAKNKELSKLYGDTKTELIKEKSTETPSKSSETYKNSLKELQDKITTLETKNSTLTTQLEKAKSTTSTAPDDFEKQLKTLQDTISTLEAKNALLNTQLTAAKASSAGTTTGSTGTKTGSTGTTTGSTGTTTGSTGTTNRSTYTPISTYTPTTTTTRPTTTYTPTTTTTRSTTTYTPTTYTPTTTSSNSGSNSALVNSLQNQIKDLQNKLANTQSNQNTSATKASQDKVKEILEKNQSETKDGDDKTDDKTDGKAVVEIDDETDADKDKDKDKASAETEPTEDGVIDDKFSFNDENYDNMASMEPEITEEEEPKKTNWKGVIFILFLIAAILGGAGYIVYTMFIRKRRNELSALDELMEDEEEGGFDDEIDLNEEFDGFDDGPEIEDGDDSTDLEEVPDADSSEINEGFDAPEEDDDDEEFDAS